MSIRKDRFVDAKGVRPVSNRQHCRLLAEAEGCAAPSLLRQGIGELSGPKIWSSNHRSSSSSVVMFENGFVASTL